MLPSVGDLDPQGLILLTDKVREIATKNLPIENFNILKQDVITKMIGEEELYKSCKEGVCIGDLAKRTNANYGARCDVISYGSNLVLKFELYSVNEDAIFETFTDYGVKDFQGMLMALEVRLPDAFKKMIAARNAETALSKPAAPLVPPIPTAPMPPPAISQPKPAFVTRFTDSRDGKTYKAETIGSQTWMAENLNYDVPNNNKDVCYGKKANNCVKYGRLYSWSTALTACPVGWHLPTDAEWTMLTDYVGDSLTAGKKLKSTSGWTWKTGNGTDEYGFSALPGGQGSGGHFITAGTSGLWWSATENDASRAWIRGMSFKGEVVGRGLCPVDNDYFLFSVRCVQD